MRNRSKPPGAFIPELAYPDVHAAAEWLGRVFGFRVRLRIGDHRIQMTYGGGAIVVMQGAASGEGHRVLVAVEDARARHARVVANGVAAPPPEDHLYGERQFGVTDPWGHRWVFSESIADADPKEWGGELVGE